MTRGERQHHITKTSAYSSERIGRVRYAGKETVRSLVLALGTHHAASAVVVTILVVHFLFLILFQPPVPPSFPHVLILTPTEPRRRRTVVVSASGNWTGQHFWPVRGRGGELRVTEGVVVTPAVSVAAFRAAPRIRGGVRPRSC